MQPLMWIVASQSDKLIVSYSFNFSDFYWRALGKMPLNTEQLSKKGNLRIVTSAVPLAKSFPPLMLRCFWKKSADLNTRGIFLFLTLSFTFVGEVFLNCTNLWFCKSETKNICASETLRFKEMLPKGGDGHLAVFAMRSDWKENCGAGMRYRTGATWEFLILKHILLSCEER